MKFLYTIVLLALAAWAVQAQTPSQRALSTAGLDKPMPPPPPPKAPTNATAASTVVKHGSKRGDMSCQDLSNIFGIAHLHTIGHKTPVVYQDIWHKQKCKTRPFSCQEVSDCYNTKGAAKYHSTNLKKNHTHASTAHHDACHAPFLVARRFNGPSKKSKSKKSKKSKKGKKGKKKAAKKAAKKAGKKGKKAGKKNRKLRKAKISRRTGRGYVRAEIYGARGARRVRVVPVYYRIVAVRRPARRPRRVLRDLSTLPIHPPLPAATALRHAQEDLAATVEQTKKNSPVIQDAIDAASLALDAARLSEALKEAATPQNGKDAANFQLPGSFTPTPRFQRLKTQITTAAEAKLKAEADAAAEAAAKQYLAAEAAARQEQAMVTELDAEMGFQADAKLGATVNADAEIQAEAQLDAEAKQALSEQIDAEKGLDLNSEEALLAEANEHDQEALNALQSALTAQ